MFFNKLARMAGVAAVGLLSMGARAQCNGQWLPGQGVPGVVGMVNAAVAWDPDGNGPIPAVLVVGGNFTLAGDVVTSNVAAWDGSAWHSLSADTSGQYGGTVYALGVYNNRLIVGGVFTSIGGTAANCIASYDGSTWQALGSGLSGSFPWINAIAVYNGDLVAAG